MNAPESADVKPGGTATFKCKYDGNPRPDVKWFKGSKQIKDADNYILTNKSQVATLEIDGVKDDDYGEYKVVVSNEYGDTEHSFSLKGGKKDDANGPSTSAKSKIAHFLAQFYFCFDEFMLHIVMTVLPRL